jgi:hypothetical protein
MILLHQIIPITPSTPLVTVKRNRINIDTIERVIQKDVGCIVVFNSGAAVDYQETDVEVYNLIQKDMVTA